MMNVEELIKKIDSYSIISFDLFDTLVERLVKKPTDVFQLVEDRYNQLHNSNISFANKRKMAEKLARKRNKNVEINFNDIYLELKKFFSDNECKKLKCLEENIEKEIIVPRYDIKKVYDYCIQNNKIIYIISDMYLPQNIISNIAISCGYDSCKKIYVSSEYKKTKQSGKLFQLLLVENNIDVKKIIHIGDNKIADYQMPLSLGIAAINIPLRKLNSIAYYRPKFFGKEELYYYIIKKFTDVHLSCRENNNRNYAIGYESFGPLLYGFAIWLKNKALELNLDKVFFCSRDGYVFAKMFQRLNIDINFSYLYVSRQALLPTVFQYDKDVASMLKRYKSWPRVITMQEIFKKLDLLNEYKLCPSKYKNKVFFSLNELLVNSELMSYLNTLKELIQDNSKIKARLFRRYLQQEQFAGNIAIVDIGSGTIESALRDFIKYDDKIEVNLKALYFSADFGKEKNNKKSFVYNDFYELEYKIRFFYMLIEAFLSAPHGSVLDYKNESGIVKPIEAKYYYSTQKNDEIMIESLRKGAIQFVIDFQKNKNRFTKKIFQRILFDFVLYPHKDDAILWGDFHIDADKFIPIAPKINGNILFGLKKSLWVAGSLKRTFDNDFLNYLLIMLYGYKVKIRRILR